MDEDIIKRFEEFGVKESAELLEEPMEMKINSEKLNRIKEKAMKKAGFEVSETEGRRGVRNWMKRGMAFAAVFAFVGILCVLASRNDGIASAFGKILSFVPGYGYVESENEVNYVYTESFDALTADSTSMQIGVNDSSVTGDSVKLKWYIANKTRKSLGVKQPEVELYIDGEKCEYISGAANNDEAEWYYTGTYEYKLPDLELSEASKYEMKFNGLKIDYKLKSCEIIDGYDSVGTVIDHNGIKINTKSSYKDGILKVGIYGVGEPSNIHSASIGGDGLGREVWEEVYKNTPAIYLETQDGKIMGKRVESDVSNQGLVTQSYEFKIPKSITKTELKLSYVVIMTTEEMNARIPIPKLNETISWDKKLELQYADLNMKSVSLKYKERDEKESRNYYLELRFDNVSKKKNAELFEVFLIETGTSGGEAEPIIEDGKLVGYDIFIDKQDTKLDDIEYTFGGVNMYKLTDVYSFPISIDANK